MALRLAVPSDGALHEPTLGFLSACGIGVFRPNLRRYTAEIPTLSDVIVHFQRSVDIPAQVEEGTVDMGIVGIDRIFEQGRENGNTGIVIDKLGFGHCQLVIGVPDSWVDVDSVGDLAELALDFRQKGMDLRVATKCPRLVERFLLATGIKYFAIVHSSGALEAAPGLGFADIVADITTTGATLRENRLKTVQGGSILTSEACLISNRTVLAADTEKLEFAKGLVEIIEGHLSSLDYYTVTANMRGEDPEQIAGELLQNSDISGLRGPTISKVYTADGEGWYAVTLVIEKKKLLGAVDHLRRIGGDSVTVSRPDYVFQSDRAAIERLT